MSSKFPGCPNDPNGPSPPGAEPFFPPYVAPPPVPPPPPPEPPPSPPDPDDPLPPSDPPGDGGDNDPGGEPGVNTMPAIVGDVEWFQDFSNLVVGPDDLNVAFNKIGVDPGILNASHRVPLPDGSQYNYVVTMHDTVLEKRVLEFQGTKEAFEKEGVTHTQISLFSNRYFDAHSSSGRAGLALHYGKAYKLSFVHNLKLGYNHDLPNNSKFNILWQLFSYQDPGEPLGANPILAFTFIDGDMRVHIRGDSDEPTEKPYQFDESYYMYAPVYNEYELIEVFFTCNHAVGAAKLQIFRNGIEVFNDQSTRIGYNNDNGFACSMGIYHYYSSPDSTVPILRRRISAIRMEAV